MTRVESFDHYRQCNPHADYADRPSFNAGWAAATKAERERCAGIVTEEVKAHDKESDRIEAMPDSAFIDRRAKAFALAQLAHASAACLHCAAAIRSQT